MATGIEVGQVLGVLKGAWTQLQLALSVLPRLEELSTQVNDAVELFKTAHIRYEQVNERLGDAADDPIRHLIHQKIRKMMSILKEIRQYVERKEKYWGKHRDASKLHQFLTKVKEGVIDSLAESGLLLHLKKKSIRYYKVLLDDIIQQFRDVLTAETSSQLASLREQVAVVDQEVQDARSAIFQEFVDLRGQMDQLKNQIETGWQGSQIAQAQNLVELREVREAVCSVSKSSAVSVNELKEVFLVHTKQMGGFVAELKLQSMFGEGVLVNKLSTIEGQVNHLTAGVAKLLCMHRSSARESSLDTKLEVLRKRFRNHKDVTSGSRLYVPLRLCRETHLSNPAVENSVNAMKKILSIIDRSNAAQQSVFLLLGEGGSGKTTLMEQATLELWRMWKEQNGSAEAWIPVFVRLPSLKDPEKRMLEEALHPAEFSQDQIEELRTNRRVVFFLDAYEVLRPRVNFFLRAGLSDWKNAKFVISIDKDYEGLIGHYTDWLTPPGAKCDEWYTAPFNLFEIQQYFAKYTEQHPEAPVRFVQECMDVIARFPVIQQLCQNPFLLSTLTRTLQESRCTSSTNEGAIQLRALLRLFVADWQERGRIRYLNGEDGEGILDYCAQCEDFCRTTALTMHSSGIGTVALDSGLDGEDRRTQKDVSEVLVMGCPLRKVGKGTYEFFPSFQEYFVSEDTITAIKMAEDTNTSSESLQMDDLLKSHHVSRMSISKEPEILFLLGECASRDPEFAEKLWLCVKQSRDVSRFSVLAANALSILTWGGISLVGQDLHGICVRGANLSRAQLSCCNLSDANLEKCLMDDVVLDSCTLEGARLRDVKFLAHRPLTEHTDAVCSVAVTADGERVVSGSFDNTICLWQVEGGHLLQILSGHTDTVRSVAVSPDGHHIVSGSADKTIRLWDMESGECISVFDGHKRTVLCVRMAPDGRRVVSGSADKYIRVWDITRGKCLWKRELSTNWRSICIHPSNGQFITGSTDKIIRVWNMDTGDIERELEGHKESVESVAVSGKGNYFVSGSKDQTIGLWKMETGECVRWLRGHRGQVTGVAVSEEENQIVSTSSDCTVRLWSLNTGDCLWTMAGHTQGVSSVKMTNKYIVSGGEDATIRLWKMHQSKYIRPVDGHTNWVRTVVVTPDGKRLVSGSDDKSIRVWNFQTGEFLRKLIGHRGAINFVTLTLNGKRILSGSDDKTVRLWDVLTGKCLRTFEGHSRGVLGVAAMPDGKHMVSCDKERYGTVKIWDMGTGNCIKSFAGTDLGNSQVTCVAVTSDGKLLVIGCSDGCVRILDWENGKKPEKLCGHSRMVQGICIRKTEDGFQAFSCSADSIICCWDLQTRKLLQTFEGHTRSVRSVAVAADGHSMVSASDDCTVRLWDLGSGNCEEVLRKDDIDWRSVTVAPCGRCIVAAGEHVAPHRWSAVHGDTSTEGKYKCCLSTNPGSCTAHGTHSPVPQESDKFYLTRIFGPTSLSASGCRLSVGTDANENVQSALDLLKFHGAVTAED